LLLPIISCQFTNCRYNCEHIKLRGIATARSSYLENRHLPYLSPQGAFDARLGQLRFRGIPDYGIEAVFPLALVLVRIPDERTLLDGSEKQPAHEVAWEA